MKTSVSVTSIHQYHAMQMFGQIAPKQLLILHKMRPGRLYSRRELSKLTGLETSCVAGRVNELLEMQQLEVVGTLRCSITHRHVEAVRLRDVQGDIFGVGMRISKNG